MAKFPTQQIFDEVFKASESLGYKTYDLKPLNEVGYPFVEMSNVLIVPVTTKTAYLGVISLTVEVWGLRTKRKQLDDMANNLFLACSRIKKTESLNWFCNTNATSINILEDTSTNTKLLHAVINFEYKFY